jgi:hypothetical protein
MHLAEAIATLRCIRTPLIVALNNGEVEMHSMLQVCGYEFGGYLEGVSL